jgi:uncharacterized protein (DUF1499 family)
LLAVLLLLVAGPGYRMHFWGLSALLLVPIAFLFGLIAAIISLVGFKKTSQIPGRGLAVTGLLAGLLAIGISGGNIFRAMNNPIHDVSTDTNDPPQFSAVLAARGSGKIVNPTTWDQKTAEIQRRIYPDIQPLDLNVPPQQAFDRALATARNMGWTIDSSDPATGHIEATATTFWYGFKDDVAIRVTAHGSGSRIDVRSESRIGQGDVGANAKRVRAYLDKLKSS